MGRKVLIENIQLPYVFDLLWDIKSYDGLLADIKKAGEDRAEKIQMMLDHGIPIPEYIEHHQRETPLDQLEGLKKQIQNILSQHLPSEKVGEVTDNILNVFKENQ